MLTGEWFCENTKKYLEEIALSKKLFLEENADPRKSHFVRHEVAESWIRSRSYGISPRTPIDKYILTEQEFQKVRRESRLLVDVAEPLINNVLSLATSSGHSLELFDANGVFLCGTHMDFSPSPVVAVDWNEKNTGTVGHTLAIYHKKPIILIGPENYLDILCTTMCTAVPILDENGDVIGALALIQDLGKRPWEKEIKRIQSYFLGWASSLSAAIENQIKLHKSYEDLEKAQKSLSVTLEFVDEGIVTIDGSGSIINANKEGCKILQVGGIENQNINDFLVPGSSLMDIVKSKRMVDYKEEYIKVGRYEKPYLISVRPVINPKSEDLDAAILRFSQSEKINALITKRSGAVANFSFADIIGKSRQMQEPKRLAQQFAPSLENVLLLGESGTGKELFAQAIHNSSGVTGPFIALNCAAMPRNLIESELFGYEGGAFTGAEKNGRPGKIELANGGTLFLDEIGDMPYELQAVLLRVLQDKMIMRIGGKQYHQVNFRLITATNQNLTHLIQEKKFRKDLYFRLSVLDIYIPPLRERGYDIVLLVEHFISTYTRKMGWAPPTVSSEVKEIILNYNWPGNVRQLENTFVYAVNLARDGVIEKSHLPKDIYSENRTDSQSDALHAEPEPADAFGMLSIKNSEKAAILNALERAGNNVTTASRLLEVSKATLYRKMKKHNISTHSN